MTALTDAEVKRRRAKLKERRAAAKLFAGDQTRTITLQTTLYLATMKRLRALTKVAQQNLATGYTFALQAESAEALIRQITDRTINMLVQQRPPVNHALQFFAPPVRAAFVRGQEAALRPAIAGTLLGADVLQTSGVLAQLLARTFNSMQRLDAGAKQILRQTLSEAVLKGWGRTAAGEVLRTRILDISEPRAQMIARTEIATARNRGYLEKTEEQTYRGQPYYYEWVASRDSKTRPSHRRRNGKIFTATQARALIGEPNCRCRIVSVSPADPRYKEVEKNLSKFV